MAYEYSRLDQDVERALNSQHFPTTDAHIISSQIIETRVMRGKARVRAWYPRIQYAFSLGDDYQTGIRLTVAPEVYFDRAVAEEIILKYPPGSIHDLFYDPDDPAFTVLEPGHQDILISEQRAFLMKWVAILITTIALTIIFWLGRKKLLPGILDITARVYGKLRKRKGSGR
jgi:hypothetical protein